MKKYIITLPDGWKLSRPCVGCHLAKQCEPLEGILDGCPFDEAVEVTEQGKE